MGILGELKRLGKTFAPNTYWNLQRRYHRALLRPVERAFLARHGTQVIGGPFAGMRYIGEATGSRLLPKLCGSYEVELRPALEIVFTQSYQRIVDVGCAEGYYAVGLSRRFPGTPVSAFDTDPAAHRLCAELCRLNGASEKVTVRGACTPATLREITGDRVLLICDCEGYEFELLDNDLLGDMPHWDLLVELHDDSPGRERAASLRRRLERAHAVEVIPTALRDPADFPVTHFLPRRWRSRALDEGRPVRQWWLWAKASR